MKFHKRYIEKGVYGELSKVKEELEEAFDAEEQGQDLMLLIELSDMVGAIEGVAKKYGFTLDQLRTFASLRSEVAIYEEKENLKNKKYKNLTMITTSYNCNKKCPYCIANTNALPEKEEDLDAFENVIMTLKMNGYSFDYFVLSGNGESSLYSINNLKRIRDIIDNSGIFKEKRIQTSGFLFFNNEKFDLFKDWIIEITRVAVDFETDSKVCKYLNDYLKTENIKKAKLRVNLVLLKNNINSILEVINMYLEQPNVETVALKILDNKNNDWITENAIGYDKIEEIKDSLSWWFGLAAEKQFSNYVWKYNNSKSITMSINKEYLEKDLDSLYWYGDGFLNRQ